MQGWVRHIWEQELEERPSPLRICYCRSSPCAGCNPTAACRCSLSPQLTGCPCMERRKGSGLACPPQQEPGHRVSLPKPPALGAATAAGDSHSTPTYDCVYLTAEPFPSRKPYLVSITSLVLPVSSKADFSSTATYLHTVERREHKRLRGCHCSDGQRDRAPGTAARTRPRNWAHQRCCEHKTHLGHSKK